MLIHYIIHFTFDIDFLKNLINLILFYVFNLTVLYIFHLYLFIGLFVYYISLLFISYYVIIQIIYIKGTRTLNVDMI